MGEQLSEAKLIRQVERDQLRAAKRSLAKAERHVQSAERAFYVAERVLKTVRETKIEAARNLDAITYDQRLRAIKEADHGRP